VSDAPGRYVIRPDPRRYRRHALSAAPPLLVAVVAVAARLAGEFGWLAAPAVVALVGPPAALFWAYARRHDRTVTMSLSAGGLELTDWRGRLRTLHKPIAVCYCTIYSGGGRMEHITVGGPLTETPLVLRTRQWRPDDLAELWRRLDLEPSVDDLTSVPGVRSRFPGVPLPYATRYPITVGLLWIIATFAYISLVVSLFRAIS
jgi:hypothetical protein